MTRRLLPAVGAALLACASRTPAATVDPAARIRSIETGFIADQLNDNPAFAANLQSPGARFDKLPDRTMAGLRAREEQLDSWRQELRAISPESLRGTPEALARDLMLTSLNGTLAMRACRMELWMVSPTFGWQGQLVEALRSQPVDTGELRAQALTRISIEAPRSIAEQTAALRAGIPLGYAPAKTALQAVIDQLRGLTKVPAHGSPLSSPGARAKDPAYAAQIEAAVDSKLLPALRAHLAFLSDELLPLARDKEGVLNLPNGEACYRAALLRFDNLDLDPRELHQTGLAQVALIETEMRALSQKSFGGEALPALFNRFRTDPQYLFKSRDQMLAEARAALDRAWAALPKAFAHIPSKKVDVEPFAAFEEKTSAPRYFPASLDGRKPGRFMIRLYEAEKQSRAGSEDLVFHEAIPGHHFQFALLQETPGLPMVSPYTFSNAFAEGWGLYAEGLADELGLYSDDATRMGMFASRSWRAARIVMDTGIHVLGWSREKAIDYMLNHSSQSADFAAAEVDRYISMPGQATSYMVGYLEIMRLRNKAMRGLGDKFDLKAFHDQLLNQGIEALPLVAARVEAWIGKAP